MTLNQRECAETWTRVGCYVERFFPYYQYWPLCGWPKRATLTPLDWWGAGSPKGDIGVALSPSQLMVLDVWPGVEGAAALLDLQLEGLPPTWEQVTPTGERQLVYSTEGTSGARTTVEHLASGIYTIGSGGFIPVYQSAPCDRSAFAPAPAWLLERIGAP